MLTTRRRVRPVYIILTRKTNNEANSEDFHYLPVRLTNGQSSNIIRGILVPCIIARCIPRQSVSLSGVWMHIWSTSNTVGSVNNRASRNPLFRCSELSPHNLFTAASLLRLTTVGIETMRNSAG